MYSECGYHANRQMVFWACVCTTCPDKWQQDALCWVTGPMNTADPLSHSTWLLSPPSWQTESRSLPLSWAGESDLHSWPLQSWLKACFYSTSFTGNTADHTRVCVSLSCMAGCLKRLFHDALIQIKLHLVPLSALSVSFTSSSTYSSGLPFAAGLRACQLQRKAFPSSLGQCHPLSHSWSRCSLLSATPQPYPPLHLSSSGRCLPDS